MDKEQAILQRLEHLKQEQLKALKELKKVEKAKKKRRRLTTHGYPIKDGNSEQKKIQLHPVGGARPRCVLGPTTPGWENITVADKGASNMRKHETPELGMLTSLSTTKRKSSKESGLDAMVKTPLRKQVTSNMDDCVNLPAANSMTDDDKAEIGIGKLEPDCSAESICTRHKKVERKVSSKETEKMDREDSAVTDGKETITPDADATSLTGSMARNKETIVYTSDEIACCLTDSITHSKETVSHNKNGSQLNENPKQTFPLQTKQEDVHLRFPKPDDCLLLKTNSHSDFVLPDKDFAMLKLGKVKLVRQLGPKEKTCFKLDKTESQPECSTDDSVVECTKTQNDYSDFKDIVGTATDQQNNQGVGDYSKALKLHSQNFDTVCIASPEHPSFQNNASYDDQYQDVFSESLLEVLGGDQNFLFTQKLSDSSTLQAMDEKGTPAEHLSSDASSYMTANVFSSCTKDLNSGQGDGLPLKMSSNEFCGDRNMCVENGERCKNVDGLMLKHGTFDENKQVMYPIDVVASSVLNNSSGHEELFEDHNEDAMNSGETMLGTSVDEKYVAGNSDVTECHSQGEVIKAEPESGDIVTVERINEPASEKNLVEGFDCSLGSIQGPWTASQATPPFAQEVPLEDRSGSANCDSTHEISEFCFQHLNKLPGSSNEVRAIKSLTLRSGETETSQVIVVCLPKLLVLWKSTDGSTWIVLHKWVLDEKEEFSELQVRLIDSCIVVLVGGTFSKTLGRVYCLLDRGDWNFDMCEEVSFSDIGESDYEFKCMCLLPSKESSENLSVVLASMQNGRLRLTKWKIDVICFCIEDSEHFPQFYGSDLSSLLLVDGIKCLLLGCVDSDIYLWNYNSCELMCKTSLQHSTFSSPVCLSAEIAMGMLFLVMFYKECKEVKLVAVNPQNGREACLKTLEMAQIIKDPSDTVLSCSKYGSYVVSGFTRGHVLLWNMACDKTKLLNPFSGDVTSIFLDFEESVVAFGTVSGSVYLNVMK